MKLCTQCENHKPLPEFSLNGRKRDGTPQYRSVCKPCYSARVRAARAGECVKQADKDGWLREEYLFLASWGLNHDAIAARLGRESHNLGRSLERLGVERALSPVERGCLERVCRQLGEPGGWVCAVFLPFELDVCRRVFVECVRRGLARRDGVVVFSDSGGGKRRYAKYVAA